MSLREEISKYIVDALNNINDPRPNLVTREPFEVDKLSITQFPAVLVAFNVENRQTVSMGMPNIGRRTGTIVYDLRGFVRGTELDTKRNILIEAIEEQLEQDRYLGLRDQGVLDSQITEIEVIPRMPPLAEVRIRVEVSYNYTRGNT